MLGSGSYPITVAELGSYSNEADRLFTNEEHERLKERLAFWPDAGDVIAGAGGVRKLLWLYKDRRNRNCEALVLYFFRDLNMPLYLIALFADGECEFDDDFREEMAALVKELVEEHGKEWARLRKPENSA
jgi:hypothetical protein